MIEINELFTEPIQLINNLIIVKNDSLKKKSGTNKKCFFRKMERSGSIR